MTAPSDAPRDDASVQRVERRWLRGTIIAAAAAAAVFGSYVAHDAAATALYESAYDRFAVADELATTSADELELLIDAAGRAVMQSDELEAVLVEGHVRPEDVTTLVAASDRLAATLADADDDPLSHLLAFPGPDALETPAWVRYADAARLLEQAQERTAETVAIEAALDDIADARAPVTGAVKAVFEGAGALAGQALADNPSATYQTRIGVQHAIDQDGPGWTHPRDSAAAFTGLVLAVEELRASHAAGEARKLEPSYPVRAEIEAFARSISHGVNLDFVWAYEVSGLTSDGWYSGTAEFWPDDGGWGIITLTHSVSDRWGEDPDATAIVVHEVGHTQAIRPECEPLFTGPEFSGDHEMWATAWAISMGHDVPGSGISAYGRPSDAQIATAGQCR
ncbi:hypothetical protein J7E25_14825 [Agromyces sp. ISL-38]|uniref:hypothetical protein n=1 Tax=Agromyces sp. ISL-38 TaxID=2819107 RepID=UPI001BE61A52|nr:hypothetical protein [Agromyces sp. ISL-38]MBT2500367.1 hypothetical protein [Agromyces sp. ISL-38]